MTRKPSQNHDGPRLTSASSAKAPLTLLTMNQPMDPVKALRPAGRMLPRKPNAPRLSTIMGTPNLGPQDDRTQWVSDPSALPMRIESRLPEAEPEHRHAEHPDEDRGELEVRRQPRPEEIDRFSVPLLQGDVFDAAWLDGGDPLAVVALPNRYVLFYVLGCGHALSP